MQQFSGACVRGVAIDGVKPFVDRADFVAVVLVFGFGQIAFELTELDISVEHIVERAAIERGNFLANERERPIARALEMSRIGRQFAGDQAQKTGFSRTVAPDNTDAPARMESQTDMFEQQ